MNKIKQTILVILLVVGLLISAIPVFIPAVRAADGWTLITDARGMKAYPDLREYVWQKDASMAPNGEYDKIGLHRLVKTGITPKGVVFTLGVPLWGLGEQRISNPPGDNWTKYENYSQAIYWANRGFDVYAIDFRSHFVPTSLNSSQLSFMADWGFDVWISDMKEAAEKVKAVSGSSKFFIAGECGSGIAALNYATKYWQDDLRGIILLDPLFFNLGYPLVATLGTETNKYNLTQAVNNMTTSGTYAYTPTLTFTPTLAAYALQNPGAPAEYPPGTPLKPTINPMTNKTWTNITEYASYNVTYNNAAYPGMWANIMGGYGNITQFEYSVANRNFMPNRLVLEINAMVDWVNCPYLAWDWNDHYKEIGVPVLVFASGLFLNRTGTLRFVNGINNPDFTTAMLKNYGHTDVFFGTYSARDLSEPAYQWMVARALTGSITLEPAAQAPGAFVAVHGAYYDFGIQKPVGIGFGAEVKVINETLPHSTGPYDVSGGPYITYVAHVPMKPGTFTKAINITRTLFYVIDTDNGNGTFTAPASAGFVNGTVDYVTGKITLNLNTSMSSSTYYVELANYTYYQYNVTPAAGVTTNALGNFLAYIVVPSVANGVYAVTAVDAQGHIATARLIVDATIPEGLTVGVMVLLSTVAVIAGTRYFRKRPKLKSCDPEKP